MPNTVALLLRNVLRSEEDEVRHKGVVTRLLARQRWGIRDGDFRSVEAKLIVSGRLGEFEVAIDRAKAPPDDQGGRDPYRMDLREVRSMVVTCAASPTAVLERLSATGELAVDVRDLVDFDAADANAVTILGSQLRRMVAGMPSRMRTRFIAFAAMQACLFDRVSGGNESYFRSLLEGDRLGRDLQLVLRPMRGPVHEDLFDVRMLDADGDRFSRSFLNELCRFRMSLSTAGVSVILS